MSTPISDAVGLKNIEADMAGEYHLTNDIELGNFEPIGLNMMGSGSTFSGVFDGRGYRIFNGSMVIADSQIGVFSGADGATIENVIIEDVQSQGTDRIGILAGYIGNGTVVRNCYVKNCSVVATAFIGYASALVADVVVGSSVEKCFAVDCVVNANNYLGGLIGNLDNSTISRCFAEVAVNGGDECGGLVGYVGSGSVVDCYALGDVSGDWDVGGLLGAVDDSLIENCYSAGAVSGSVDVGGLIGFDNLSTINDCYYDSDITGQSDMGKGEPQTTAAMKNIVTFSAWDIEAQSLIMRDQYGWNENHIWGIGIANQGYPFLRLDLLNLWVKKTGWKFSGECWVKKSNVWKRVSAIWVKKGGRWIPV